jgi:hypothetical protein
MAKLGTLIEVNLREAWKHEAHSFTPWLAEHLDQLADVIGIPLEFEGREVAVDNFSADILARNPWDDSLVLIENQLESTDHTHLGQIMTYLAGLDARTVIWVAAEFREAHLSALNWLNEHTVEPFAFFAVKVKAVRIDNSPIAPVFEVLSRPNDWNRRLQSIAKESSSMSNLGQFRKSFWTYYLERFPTEKQYGPAGGAISRWRALPDLNLAVSIYLAQNRVGIYIRGVRGMSGDEVYGLLAPKATELKAATGVEIGQSDRGHFFLNALSRNTLDQHNWEQLADWLCEMANTYESALKSCFVAT